MSLLDLSGELIICVASFLRQVDLLNISLTCKHLRYVTEPELFREYINIRPGCHPFLPFIKKIIERPKLADYVQRVDLKSWESLDILYPRYQYDAQNGHVLEELRADPLSEPDYNLLTEAAKAAGVITAIDQYEPRCRLIDYRDIMSVHNYAFDDPWCKHLLDSSATWDEIPYDIKYCQLLRAGIEDSFVVLILALLPNVKKIFLRGGPQSVNMLEWKAHHNFASLRGLTVCGTGGDSLWPVAFFNTLLPKTRLKTFQVQAGSSWYTDIERNVDESKTMPLILQPCSLSHLRRLEMKRCSIKIADMQTLLRACTGLKSFHYYGGSEEHFTLHSPSPAKMIELLDPLKDSLEELSLELSPYWFENITDSSDERLESLAHMAALKILDTTAEMWHAVDLEDAESDESDQDTDDVTPDKNSRLCFRLPPSLHTLVFHMSDDGVEPAISQLKDLIEMRPEVLPSLEYLYVRTDVVAYNEELDDLIDRMEDRLSIGRRLNVTVGGDDLETVFDTVVPPGGLPDTKWFGNKYASRRRKPQGVLFTMGSDGYRIHDMDLSDDPEQASELAPEEAPEEAPELAPELLEMLMRSELERKVGPVEYYLSDEEEFVI